MTGQAQEAIPVPEPPRTGPCAWCGAVTSLQIVLEQSWTTSRGQRVPKSTKWAWVCTTHERTLQRRES